LSNQNQHQSGHRSQIDETASVQDDIDLIGLQNRLEAHSGQIDGLREKLQQEGSHREQVESRLDEFGDRLDTVEKEVRRLDARTDLLELVENADEMSGKQRSIALIQHLKRAAEREQDRGRDAKASVNREDAEAALHHPDVDRTTIYDDMRRAVRLVDDQSILWYGSKSGGKSRLKINLEQGDLPSQIVSEEVNHGGK
jgi:septal ring factor EnvC (AmiA/AmiB activator)